MITAATDNTLGFLALLAYIATLLPSNLRVVFPVLQPSHFLKMLLKHRRTIGICAWVLAMAHVYFVIHQHHLAISDLNFYLQSMSGLGVTLIFGLLALTSNRWSMKKLKSRWKQLHNLTYLAPFLLLWHILDKMLGPWTFTTGIAIVLLIPTLYLIGIRKYLQL
jgi:methionine sulfoxide reductase heme-binding subunit